MSGQGRRRIIPFNNPINPRQGGKAGAKDPRRFISGNNAGDQWDMVQFADDRAALYDGAPPPQYSEAHAGRAAPEFVARTTPIRINFVPWVITVLAGGPPQLLVPKNLGRLDITMSAPNGVPIYYSWGFPNPDPAVAGSFVGTHLDTNQPLQRQGGVCPINDLYVFGGTIGSRVIAWEGLEAQEANFV